ncbi:hypothetical protein F2P79_006193 [Pimephales promelas]|nr:hypothetical protein F2P79_006193 [Pimephales promelas]
MSSERKGEDSGGAKRKAESEEHRKNQWLEARLTAAETIFHSLNDQSLRLFYYFLEWVLPKFTDLNQYFQSEKVVITSLRSKVCETYTDLLLTFMDRDHVLRTPLKDIDINNGPKVTLSSMYLGIKDSESVDAESLIAQTTMGIYVIRAEGAGPEEEPSDVGVALEGVEVLQNLPSMMLFGLIYALDLNYPKYLKCTFENPDGTGYN